MIIFLNMFGDITIDWDDKDHIKVLQLVDKLMQEGVTFFILKPRFFGLTEKKERLYSLKEVSGKLVIPDSRLDMFRKLILCM